MSEPVQISNRKAVILCVIMAFFLGSEIYCTRKRNEVWRTEESLWRDAVATSPHNGRALMNLGVALMSKGRYPESAYYFERALQYAPDYSTLYVNLGVLSAATGHWEEANLNFMRALSLAPGSAESYTYYEYWLRKNGKIEAADNIHRRLSIVQAGDEHLRQRQAEK